MISVHIVSSIQTYVCLFHVYINLLNYTTFDALCLVHSQFLGCTYVCVYIYTFISFKFQTYTESRIYGALCLMPNVVHCLHSIKWYIAPVHKLLNPHIINFCLIGFVLIHMFIHIVLYLFFNDFKIGTLATKETKTQANDRCGFGLRIGDTWNNSDRSTSSQIRSLKQAGRIFTKLFRYLKWRYSPI